MEFDNIPYEDLTIDGTLGAGSFGVVKHGTYLGIEVAVKEVLPSTDYEVRKYFEREWRIMKESRHPNVVLYLGLSRLHTPPPGKIFIISEFIENGNLRTWIWDKKNKPFPWRLRVSFATDISRALAYLHARKCIHRDLKGENLLITSNERVKITDFGFARIAARNEDEMRRMSYCGTDGYSPEILKGEEFDEKTDVFSLGIIFCEIISRRLVDADTFKRTMPKFILDPIEIQDLASPGCPPAFIQLAIDCSAELPEDRPAMLEVLKKLRNIELEILGRLDREGDTEHVGSIKFFPNKQGDGNLKRPGGVPKRIPSFGMGVGSKIRGSGGNLKKDDPESGTDDESDLQEVLEAIGTIKIGNGGASGTWRTAQWSEETKSKYEDASEMRGHMHLISTAATVSEGSSTYSTVVFKKGNNPTQTNSNISTASILTIKHENTPAEAQISPVAPVASAIKVAASPEAPVKTPDNASAEQVDEVMKIPQSAFTHRFTVVKSNVTEKYASFFNQPGPKKCTCCKKKMKKNAPFLSCDDCGMVTHVKCSAQAPRNCGLVANSTPSSAANAAARLRASFQSTKAPSFKP